MNSILSLLRKDFSLFRRDRAAVALTFIVPFALIYLFGQVFGVNQKDPGPTGIRLAVVNACADPAAAQLVTALQQEKTFRVVTQFHVAGAPDRPLTEADLRPLMKADEFRFAVVLPPDLVGGTGTGTGLHLKFLTNPRNEIETQMVTGLLQRTIFTAAPQLFGQALQNRARAAVGALRVDQFNQRLADAIADTYGGNRADILRRMQAGSFGLPAAVSGAGGGDDDALGRFVRIERVQVAGNDVHSPTATLLVGGWAMQFLLFAVSASAAALFYEKDRGLFQRILSAPVSRADVLWSKFIYGICLGLIQLMVLFFAGHVLFGIDIQHHLPLLLLVATVAAAACTSFGLLLAAVVQSPDAARGLATFVILIMCAIGGAWFPISFMPEFIQHLSRLTIVYWAMEGFSQVLWSHASLVELLPTLGILAGITALVMGVAWWNFRRGKIFD
jgi:ABC-2 type transport system permease protein